MMDDCKMTERQNPTDKRERIELAFTLTERGLGSNGCGNTEVFTTLFGLVCKQLKKKKKKQQLMDWERPDSENSLSAGSLPLNIGEEIEDRGGRRSLADWKHSANGRARWSHLWDGLCCC